MFGGSVHWPKNTLTSGSSMSHVAVLLTLLLQGAQISKDSQEQGPYALVVQMLALALLHTGVRVLVSYTGCCVVAAAEMRNNGMGHCKAEQFTVKKNIVFHLCTVLTLAELSCRLLLHLCSVLVTFIKSV